MHSTGLSQVSLRIVILSEAKDPEIVGATAAASRHSHDASRPLIDSPANSIRH